MTAQMGMSGEVGALQQCTDTVLQLLAGVMQCMMSLGRTEMAVKGTQEAQMYEG